MPIPLEVLIERWFAIGLLIFGLSHLLYPDPWAAAFLPLRERAEGGLVLATFTMPLGLAVVLAHNVWVWGLPVIVTLMGWAMIVKSLFYLFVPRATSLLMADKQRMHAAFRVAGVVGIVLGGLLANESFGRR